MPIGPRRKRRTRIIVVTHVLIVPFIVYLGYSQVFLHHMLSFRELATNFGGHIKVAVRRCQTPLPELREVSKSGAAAPLLLTSLDFYRVGGWGKKTFK